MQVTRLWTTKTSPGVARELACIAAVGGVELGTGACLQASRVCTHTNHQRIIILLVILLSLLDFDVITVNTILRVNYCKNL